MTSINSNEENSLLIQEYMFAGLQVFNVAVNKKDGSSPQSGSSVRSEPVSSITPRNIVCKSRICKDPEKKLQASDDAHYLNIDDIECCSEKNAERAKHAITKANSPSDPCLCACDCTIGIIKKTTYCDTCKGYKFAGEDLVRVPPYDSVHPCPVFHKIIDLKNSNSSWGSGYDGAKIGSGKFSGKLGGKNVNRSRSNASTRSPSGNAKSVASGNLKKHMQSQVSSGASADTSPDRNATDKKHKHKIDPRFVFHYGYTGIPAKIGHTRCMTSCDGTCTQESEVPKHMGWNWNAAVLGMKHRPGWKPGAALKYVVRMYRMAMSPEKVFKKKKQKLGKRKRNEKRPMLIVHKKDGEYNITMESMKTYPKERTINQQPFEDKQPLSYIIGRTEEENLLRMKKKRREERRLERDKRNFLQDTFKNVCAEICQKTYEQALGLLPGAEDPQCRCLPDNLQAGDLGMNLSCSCSEEDISIDSDTDDDEWILEFNPPNALYVPSFKPKKVTKTDNSSQYTYLDYRVKLLDKSGNQVPRYFTGPDGKTQCSDLGGFWGPDKKWIEINVDGYIAPDGRWAPNLFIGPEGDKMECLNGKFQLTNGTTLVMGIDGYVDKNGNWCYYKSRSISPAKSIKKAGGPDKKPGTQPVEIKSVSSWSCLGDASALLLAEMGIVGHGVDRKALINKLKDLQSRGLKIAIPQTSRVPQLGNKRSKKLNKVYNDNVKCVHTPPSKKGVKFDERGHKIYFKFDPETQVRKRLQRLKQAGDHYQNATSKRVRDTVMFPEEHHQEFQPGTAW